MIVILGEKHRRAIVAAIPGITITPQAWKALANIIGRFERMPERRKRYPVAAGKPSIVAKRKRWQRIDKLTRELADELRSVKKGTLWSDSDSIDASMWSTRKYYATASRGFRGTQDPDRAELFRRIILNVWIKLLGCTPTYSRDDYHKGRPYGPLIDFLDAVVRPLLGDKTPGPSGLAKIIDRVKPQRMRPYRRFPSKRQK